jgi:4-amino-4-deoxy-L-arabinose transferase-like glycosyltransferase
MVATLVLVAAVRLRLMNLPLERDEGEYAYAGQLMLQGIPPYELAYNMKFPGTYASYAAIMAVFGQTPAGIHFGILLLTTVTALMLFWLGKQMLDATAGVVAASAYAVLAASPAMLGLAGHATHFCAFFAAGGLCAMWQARQDGKLLMTLASGLLFGTAVLMKQHAALIALWASLAWTVWRLRQPKVSSGQRLASLAVFGAGIILPFGVCCLVLWRAGVFASFWFWTIDYARQYASLVPLDQAPRIFWQSFVWVAKPGILLWLAAGGGLALLWREERLRGARGWLLGVFLASAACVCPDLYFRKHYFLIMLPALALLAAAAVSTGSRLWAKNGPSRLGNWPVWAFAVAVLTVALANADIWFVQTPEEAARTIYGPDLLSQTQTVAQFIRDNSSPDTRIAVLGSEPQIYFLARRHSATGYLYTYPLMEPQPYALRMQEDMIRELETRKPEFVVFVDNRLSWGQWPESNRKIFDWWDSCRTNYTLVGLADVVSSTNTVYAFGAETASRYGGKIRGNGLQVYQRRDAQKHL